MKNDCYFCAEEAPKGQTRARDWNLESNRPVATSRTEYAQSDKTTGQQISESGLTSRMPL